MLQRQRHFFLCGWSPNHTPKKKLGYAGGALAWVLSFWNNVALMTYYIWWSGIWKESLREGLQWECLQSAPVFIGLAIPGALMLLCEVWVFEAMTLLSGYFGPVELSAQTVLTNLESLFFMIPLGISTACTTRVGNALGHGEPESASRALKIGLGWSLITVSGMVLFLLMGQHLVVGIFTKDPATVDKCAPESARAACQGKVGNQKEGALLNFVAYWGVGLPCSIWFAFGLGWRLPGLWNGLCVWPMGAGDSHALLLRQVFVTVFPMPVVEHLCFITCFVP